MRMGRKSHLSNPIVIGLITVVITALASALVNLAFRETPSPGKTFASSMGIGILLGFVAFVISFCYRLLHEGKLFSVELEKKLMQLWTIHLTDIFAKDSDIAEGIKESNGAIVNYRNLLGEFKQVGRIFNRENVKTCDYKEILEKWIDHLTTFNSYKTINTYLPHEMQQLREEDPTIHNFLKKLNDLPHKIIKQRLQIIDENRLRNHCKHCSGNRKSEAEEFSKYCCKELIAGRYIYGSKFNLVAHAFATSLQKQGKYSGECAIINDNILVMYDDYHNRMQIIVGKQVVEPIERTFRNINRDIRPVDDIDSDFKELVQRLDREFGDKDPTLKDVLDFLEKDEDCKNLVNKCLQQEFAKDITRMIKSFLELQGGGKDEK